MKKNKFILFLFVLAINMLHAQKWQKTYGQYTTEENVKDIIESYDFGYILNGCFEENEKNLLIKTDINGDILWEKEIIWSDNGYLYWGYIAQDFNSNIFIFCQFSKPGVGTWPILIKLNPCAELIWCKVFADYDYWFGFPTGIHILENGDIILMTHFEDNLQIDQSYLYYITANGNFLWKKSIASKSNYPLIESRGCERFSYINNKYLISGFCYYPYPGNLNVVYLRPFVIMLNQEFEEIWVKPFGISDSILGKIYDVIPTSDSTYMGVGTRRFVPPGGGLVNNTLLMFFNNNGDELGYIQIPNDSIGPDIGSNYILDIERINDSLFMAVSNFGEEDQGNPFGEFILDKNGHIYNKHSIPNSGALSEMIRTHDNKFVVASNLKVPNLTWDIGYSKYNDYLEDDSIYSINLNYDSLCPYQITSGTIDVAGSAIITDVSEYPTRDDFLKQQNKVSIKIVPNPSDNGQVNILISNGESYHELELDVFNIFGQKVHHATLEKETESLLINTQEWPSGIYLLTLFNQNRSIGQAKMIIQ